MKFIISFGKNLSKYAKNYIAPFIGSTVIDKSNSIIFSDQQVTSENVAPNNSAVVVYTTSIEYLRALDKKGIVEFKKNLIAETKKSLLFLVVLQDTTHSDITPIQKLCNENNIQLITCTEPLSSEEIAQKIVANEAFIKTHKTSKQCNNERKKVAFQLSPAAKDIAQASPTDTSLTKELQNVELSSTESSLQERAKLELVRLQSIYYRATSQEKVKALQNAIKSGDDKAIAEALEMRRHKTWDKAFKNTHSKPTSYLNAVQLPQLDESYHQPIKNVLNGNTMFGGKLKKLQVEGVLSHLTHDTTTDPESAKNGLDKIFPQNKAKQELARLKRYYLFTSKKIKALENAIKTKDETKIAQALEIRRYKVLDKIRKNTHSKPTSYLNAVQLPQLDESYHQPIKNALNGSTMFGGNLKKLQVEGMLSHLTHDTTTDPARAKTGLDEILYTPTPSKR
jgi:hypothetical protein